MDIQHSGGKSTIVNAGNSKVILRTVFSDGVELVEEIDSQSKLVVVRRWKTPAGFGKSNPWIFELGEPITEDESGQLLKLSSRNPSFVAKETVTTWEWYVRNIPYDFSVYQLEIDEEKDEIVLRTSNKKYFKRFYIPSLRRRGQKLDPRALQLVEHVDNVLKIQYRKPLGIIQSEAIERKQTLENCGTNDKNNVDCKTQ